MWARGEGTPAGRRQDGEHPAIWPRNEIVADKVIVPPNVQLTDEQIAAEGVTVPAPWFRYEEQPV